MANNNFALTTSGPGISQAYNGFGVANALSIDFIHVQVPYWDFANNQIAYRDVLAQLPYDGTQGGYMEDAYLELLWQDVVQEFYHANQPDYGLSQFFILDSIYQEIPINNTPFIAINVIDIQPPPNGWYNTSNPVFAKYGFCKAKTNGNFIGQPNWINESGAFFQLSDLADTCAFQWVGNTISAVAQCYGKLLPPKLTYTGFDSGQYPH